MSDVVNAIMDELWANGFVPGDKVKLLIAKHVVPLEQELAEIERLRAELETEKARRIHWQTLAYAGMRVIDAVAGNRLQRGEGVSEDTCEIAARMAIDKVAFLKSQAARAAGGGDE